MTDIANIYKGQKKKSVADRPTKIVTSISNATKLMIDGKEVWVANPDAVRRLEEKVDNLINDKQNLQGRIQNLERLISRLL